MENKSKQKIGEIIILILIALNLIFIFGNSAISTEKSSNESEAVKDAVLEVVPEDSKIGGFVSGHVRHIGHFTEYATLAALVALLIIMKGKAGIKSLVYSLLFGQLTGFFDETVQIFSGRGPNIADVWIDIFGYATATAAVTLAWIAVRAIKKSKGI